MAGKEVIARAMELLLAQWPRQPINDVTMVVYSRVLGDLPDRAVEAAVEHVLSTNTYFPTAAEIRAVAIDIMCSKLNILSCYEAWERVVNYLRKPPTIFRNGRRWRLKPLDDVTERAVAHIGGWDVLRRSENLAVERANFYRAYEDIVARVHQELGKLPSVRRAEAEIGAGKGGMKSISQIISLEGGERGE